MKNNKQVKKILSFLWVPVLLLLITIPIVLPYAHKGYFPTHDGEWAVVRLGDMFREIRDHQFPPRYSGNLNFGFGYPLFEFAYPLPYYAGLIVHFLKFSFVDSIKLLFAGTVVVSTIFMYLASKEFWGRRSAGFVSALLFAYLPYRLVDLYARGSIGESFAFVFFAFLFYCWIKLYHNPKSLWYVGMMSLGISGLILSHNIMATLFLPVFVVFVGATMWKDYKKYLIQFISACFLGLAGASFFWLPALAEKNLILLSKIPIADRSINYVTIWDLLFRPWGYGIPEAATGGFTYQIGWPHLIVFLGVCFFVLFSMFKKRPVGKQERTGVVLLFLAILMALMLFPFTNGIWKTIPLLKEINYPWTFLGPIGFVLSFLGGYLCSVKKRWVTISAVLLGITALLLYLPYARPQKFTYNDDSYYFTNDATTTSSSEYTPLWVMEKPLSRVLEKVEIISGKGIISNLSYSSKYTAFDIAVSTPSLVRINTIYYPGWKITVEGKEVSANYSNSRGVMDISLPTGSHKVKATFGETPLRLFSDLFSLAGIGGILFLLAVSLLKKKENI